MKHVPKYHEGPVRSPRKQNAGSMPLAILGIIAIPAVIGAGMGLVSVLTL
jgi:hypothetical protein